MHHRIMVCSERESKNGIAGFRGLNPQIPAISNAAESEKQTPAQSLRGFFTDDSREKSRSRRHVTAGLNSERMPHLRRQLPDRASVLARCVILVGKIKNGGDNGRGD